LFGASGKTLEWNAIDDMSLLELAEEGGVEVPNDCRAGACHTCQSKILDGATTAAHLMPDGSPGALLCIGRPSSRTVTINA
jgi:ferredoxin